VKKKDLTQSVNKIDGENTRFTSFTNIYEMIKGEKFSKVLLPQFMVQEVLAE
jgi:hypothetical protein